MGGSGWRVVLCTSLLCALATAEGALDLATREAELRRAIALAQHGKLGVCNTVVDCPVWNKGGSCRNGRCRCPEGLTGMFCIKKVAAAQKARAPPPPPPSPPPLPAGTHSCLHKVRLCTDKSDCNPQHCPGCSCDPCGQCACVDPFRGAFCEEHTHVPTPAPTPRCHSITRHCHGDRDCNGAECDGCTCAACGRCACTAEWSGPRCATKTRAWYEATDRKSGTPFCTSHSDCNGHACAGCKCLITGKCACTLGFSGDFCTNHARAKIAHVPIWKRTCQVAQDCNWPHCADCACGKDFTCRCAPGFHGDNCDNKKHHGAESGPSAEAGATTNPPTAAPTAPKPTPPPGPTTTPWPTPIVQCLSEGDCNYPVCATCSCFHGGCRCAEGWTGIFCTEKATKAPKEKAAPTPPTPAPTLPNLIPRADQLPCYVTRDCAMAVGAKCYRGVCQCPKGTGGITCESLSTPTPKPTPAPTPFDMKSLKVPKGQMPCFSPGDCNWHAGGKCVNHICQCPEGYSGLGCMQGPTPAPTSTKAGVGVDTSSFQAPPTTTPWPTPMLGCRVVGDCNAAKCKTCTCYHGGCKCAEGYHGTWCQDHAPEPAKKRSTAAPSAVKPKSGENDGLAGVLKKVETLKEKVAQMFSEKPGTLAPADAKREQQSEAAHSAFDSAFGYDDGASAGMAGVTARGGSSAYYAQKFWPGSEEAHDAVVSSKSKHFWPKASYFPGTQGYQNR